MNNDIYVSSGTMVGRMNRYDFSVFAERAHSLDADGFELMMIPAYYDTYPKVLKLTEQKNIDFKTVHIEKQIGISLAESTPQEEIFKLFEKNCEIGEAVGAKRAVFHLWSGSVSDSRIENNLAQTERLLEISQKHSLELLFENVPTTTYSPYKNLELVHREFPDIHFVYDTRFSAFHNEHSLFLLSGWFEKGVISHMHVSDVIGRHPDFSCLRPVRHIGEGDASLDRLLPVISKRYDGSITVECSAIVEGGALTEPLARDIELLRKYTK